MHSYRRSTQSPRVKVQFSFPKDGTGKNSLLSSPALLCLSLFFVRLSLGCLCRRQRHIPRRQNLLGPHSLTQMSTSVPNSLALGRSRVLCYKQTWRDPFFGGWQQFLYGQNNLHRHLKRYVGQFLVGGSYIMVSLPSGRHTVKKSSDSIIRIMCKLFY